MEQHEKKQNGSAQTFYISLLLALLALASVAAASVAWFTIADHTKLHSIGMNVTAGPAIRFDLDKHGVITDYKRTLTFEEIADRILADRGFDLRERPMDPVTTQNGMEFTLRNGAVVSADSGSYLEFTLHFIATKDVLVHLTSANSAGRQDGTLVTSETSETLPQAMRISFTADGQTVVFSPGMGDRAVYENGLRTFGLPDAMHMVYTEKNTLFALQGEVDKPVVVRIWMEGTDPACENSLQGADYSIRLRFEATGADNEQIETE